MPDPGVVFGSTVPDGVDGVLDVLQPPMPATALALAIAWALSACTAPTGGPSVAPSEGTAVASASASASPSEAASCTIPEGATPSARGYVPMVSLSDGVLLYGGSTGPPPDGIFLHDIWTFRPTDGWRSIESCPTPPYGTGIAYDAESQQVILFGTVVSDQPQSPRAETAQTWSFDPATEGWTNLDPAGGPTGLFAPVMAYDAQSDRVILFGGNNTVGQSGATWAYDVDANSWTQMDPAASPPQRAFGLMAYDAGSDRVILFGGGNDARDFGDTWAYDYDTDTWTEMSPAGGPVATAYAAMAYDPATDQIILFGGAPYADNETPLGETWAYDYETDTWALIEPPSSPSARGWHSLALDPASGLLVLFGGGVDRDHYQADTWTYNPDANVWAAY